MGLRPKHGVDIGLPRLRAPDARQGTPLRGWLASAAERWQRAVLGRGPGGGLLLAGTLGLAYLVLAQFVLRLNDPQHAGANFWPAAGLTMGALLLLPGHRWPWALVAIAVAEATSDWLMDYSLVVSASLITADTVEPLLGAALMRRFGPRDGRLIPVPSLLRFIAFGVVIAPIVGGSIGTIGSVQSGADLWRTWPQFIVADALGVLVVAPVLLSMRPGQGLQSLRADLALVAATLVVSAFALRSWPAGWDTVTPYAVIPVLTWAALRSGIRGTAWSVLAMGQVANFAVAGGTEPFAATSETGYSVTLLQGYLAVVASSSLILAAAATDLRGRDQREAVLRWQASHDPLTGLLNRLHLAGEIEARLAQPRAPGRQVAMLVIDLDNFKDVNDALGHAVGDTVIVEMARRLQSVLREVDLVARLGGDEFLVLVTDATDEAIDAVAARIGGRLSAPLVVGAQAVEVTVSIGVATALPDSTADSLLHEADAALYQAKALGRDQVAHA